MLDIGLDDSCKNMVLGLHAYVEDPARQAERDGGRNTHVVTSQTQHEEWATRAPFLISADDVAMGDLQALDCRSFRSRPAFYHNVSFPSTALQKVACSVCSLAVCGVRGRQRGHAQRSSHWRPRP